MRPIIINLTKASYGMVLFFTVIFSFVFIFGVVSTLAGLFLISALCG